MNLTTGKSRLRSRPAAPRTSPAPWPRRGDARPTTDARRSRRGQPPAARASRSAADTPARRRPAGTCEVYVLVSGGLPRRRVAATPRLRRGYSVARRASETEDFGAGRGYVCGAAASRSCSSAANRAASFACWRRAAKSPPRAPPAGRFAGTALAPLPKYVFASSACIGGPCRGGGAGPTFVVPCMRQYSAAAAATTIKSTWENARGDAGIHRDGSRRRRGYHVDIP